MHEIKLFVADKHCQQTPVARSMQRDQHTCVLVQVHILLAARILLFESQGIHRIIPSTPPLSLLGKDAHTEQRQTTKRTFWKAGRECQVSMLTHHTILSSLLAVASEIGLLRNAE